MLKRPRRIDFSATVKGEMLFNRKLQEYMDQQDHKLKTLTSLLSDLIDHVANVNNEFKILRNAWKVK